MSEVLRIDNDYYRDMGRFLEEEGKQLKTAIDTYIKIIKDAEKVAVISGDMSLSLSVFNILAGSVSDEIKKITDTVAQKMRDYTANINEADHFVF